MAARSWVGRLWLAVLTVGLAGGPGPAGAGAGQAPAGGDAELARWIQSVERECERLRPAPPGADWAFWLHAELAQVQAKSGDAQGARARLRRALEKNKPGPGSYGNVARVVAECGDAGLAAECLRTYYAHLAAEYEAPAAGDRAFAASSAARGATAVAAWQAARGDGPPAREALARAGQWLDVLKGIKGEEEEVAVGLAATAVVSFKLGEPADGNRALAEAKRLLADVGRTLPANDVGGRYVLALKYRDVAAREAEAGLDVGAIVTVSRMPLAQQPEALVNLANVMAKNGRADQARQTLATAWQLAGQLKGTLHMPAAFYAAFANATDAVGGDPGPALARAKEFAAAGHATVYYRVAEVEARRGDPGRARATLGLVPAAERGSMAEGACLQEIAKAQARAGDVDGAVRTAGQIPEHLFRTAGFQQLAAMQVRAGGRAPALAAAAAAAAAAWISRLESPLDRAYADLGVAQALAEQAARPATGPGR